MNQNYMQKKKEIADPVIYVSCLKVTSVSVFILFTLWKNCIATCNIKSENRLLLLPFFLLGWESLAERRPKANVKMTYQILNDHADIAKNKFIHTPLNNTRSRATQLTPYCITDTYKQSLFPGAARIWNTVPTVIRNQSSVSSFNNSIGSTKLLQTVD